MNETKNLMQEKLDIGYGNQNLDNFVTETEITVEITLREYRELIKNNALSQNKIENAEKDRYARNYENEELKKKLKEITRQLNKYINEYGILEEYEILEEESENEYE